MTTTSLPFLKRLLDTPGPSGFETAPARVWRDEVKGFADEVRADTHGNSIAAINPKGTPRLMFAGHIDEIGLQVTHVDDEGYVYFAAIGGWDPQVLVGQRVVLLGPAGPVRGVIGKKAVHMMKKDELDKYAWFADNSGDMTHPVGEKKANPWGLFDIHGNVPEWCWDRYDPEYYKRSPVSDPPGSGTGEPRVHRGGAWNSAAAQTRSSSRDARGIHYAVLTIVGLRVARDAEP